jgi:hypothetical protein
MLITIYRKEIPATVPVVLDICMQCQKRAVAYQLSLLEPIDKVVLLATKLPQAMLLLST